MPAPGQSVFIPRPDDYDETVWAAVGIDLIDVSDVRESIGRFGSRYLRRVYTATELRERGGSVRRLAECLAAKEAAMKALPGDERLPWHSIAVVGDRPRPVLQLTGPAADTAQSAGLRSASVSFTNSGPCAAAIVVMEAA